MNTITTLFTDAGLLAPTNIEADGKIHRFRANPSKGRFSDSGWYVFYPAESGAVYGALGDWSLDLTIKTGGRMSEADRSSMELQIRQAQIEEDLKHESVSREVTSLWESLSEAPSDHPYLQKKGLKGSHGARLHEDKLVLPLRDITGKIWSIQSIDAEGKKKYRSGGKVGGCFTLVGEGNPCFIAEGFATACSVYEATGKACAVAFSAGNLQKISGHMPSAVIVADNDASGTGEREASKCANRHILIPKEGMDANDYVSEFGLDALKDLLMPGTRHEVYPLSAFIAQPKPRGWVVKPYIPKGKALCMTFGPSGGGKTFVLIERMMRAASEGFKVLYLIGEGEASARERMAAWLTAHRDRARETLQNLFVSTKSFKIDSPSDISVVAEECEQMNIRPDWIVVDTLIRFMEGDENDTRSANQFITACDAITSRFDCPMSLVHHTGLADDAQKRARGSSAFRGALDFQDLVTKNGEFIRVEQTKNKGGREAEELVYQIRDIPVEGFFDEDGGQIETGVLHVFEGKAEEELPPLDAKAEEIISMALESGFFMLDELRITRDAVRRYISQKTALVCERKDGESDEAFHKRASDRSRKRLERFFDETTYLEPSREDGEEFRFVPFRWGALKLPHVLKRVCDRCDKGVTSHHVTSGSGA